MRAPQLCLILSLSLWGCVDAAAPPAAPLPVPSPAFHAANGSRVVQVATSWLGTPYHYGGEVRGPGGGVDCSHLVHAIYKEAGLGYPYADTHSFPPSGYFVKLPQGVQAQDGDVVLFSGHMGIFVGGHDGEIISAQGSTSKPGKVQYGEAEWFGAKVGVFRWAR